MVSYKINDTVLRSTVLRLTRTSWDSVFTHEAQCYYSDFVPARETIEILDYNGDSLPDLRIVHNYWDIHPGDQGFLWVFNNDRFQPVKGFENIINPQYDYTTQKIYAYQSDGCGDMSMQFWVYELRGPLVKEINNISCDCCDYENSSWDTCVISDNHRSFSVHAKMAYKSVPAYFSDMLKWKTGLANNK